MFVRRYRSCVKFDFFLRTLFSVNKTFYARAGNYLESVPVTLALFVKKITVTLTTPFNVCSTLADQATQVTPIFFNRTTVTP